MHRLVVLYTVFNYSQPRSAGREKRGQITGRQRNMAEHRRRILCGVLFLGLYALCNDTTLVCYYLTNLQCVASSVSRNPSDGAPMKTPMILRTKGASAASPAVNSTSDRSLPPPTVLCIEGPFYGQSFNRVLQVAGVIFHVRNLENVGLDRNMRKSAVLLYYSIGQ